tara:strand:+ start:63 stop:674 length:612 start_codon:yes stop_codon:yes gene_type:complete
MSENTDNNNNSENEPIEDKVTVSDTTIDETNVDEAVTNNNTDSEDVARPNIGISIIDDTSAETVEEQVENKDENRDEHQVEDKAPESKKVSFMLDIESKALVETLTDTLEGFGVNDLMVLVPRLMQHVQNYKNLSGANKKALVIRMINHVIDVTDAPGDDDILDPIVKRLVPGMIDLLVDVDGGSLRLKKPSSLRKIFSCMCK